MCHLWFKIYFCTLVIQSALNSTFKVPKIKILKMKEAISFHNYPTSGCVVRKALYCKIGDFIKKFTLAMKQFILLSMMKSQT